MPSSPSSPSQRSKRVHPSSSTPLLRPSPLSQVVQPAPEEEDDDDGGRTPTALRMRDRDRERNRDRDGERDQDGRGRSTTEQATLRSPTSQTRPHTGSGTSSGQRTPANTVTQPRQIVTSPRRPQTARSYFQQLQLQHSPSPGGGSSQIDYLNGGFGFQAMHVGHGHSPTHAHAHAPRPHPHQQPQQPVQHAPLPPPKTRGRSHTITAASPPSSSPSTSPDTSSASAAAASPPLGLDSFLPRKTPRRLAAPSMMYWSRPPVHSVIRPTKGVRGGSATVVDGNSIWFFGGYDGKGTSDEVWVLDTETMEWFKLEFHGDRPPPLRAHTAVLHETNIFVFGGGSADEFSNELWMLDTIEQMWYNLPITNPITPRRAHVSFIYDDRLFVFGGGDGLNALADMWSLDVSRAALARAKDEGMAWEEVETFAAADLAGAGGVGVGVGDGEGGEGAEGGRPRSRGYMTANLVGNVLVVLGGQSGLGGEKEGPWGDCWILSLETMQWEEKHLNPPLALASHSATLVGMYLFIFGGNDGSRYNNDLHLLNLITMQWETKSIRGHAPPERAQHQAVLVDARLWIFGGFDGKRYFDEPYILDLAGSSYLVGVTEFRVAEDEEGWDEL